jgi:hypothetical protein
MLPDYVTLRRKNPVRSDRVPNSAIDASRTAAGIAIVSLKMLLADIPKDKIIDEDRIYDFANGNNPEGENLFVKQAGDIFYHAQLQKMLLSRFFAKCCINQLTRY